MYRGDIRLGDTIDIKFTTRSFSTGAPTQLAGTPSVAAYPGNSTTEITAGITLTVDFDARTGLNNVRVVATSGNGYATATNYDLVITAGTVGGVSVVGEVVGSFSIEARSALMPTTAARTLDVSAGGEAGLDWANIGSPTTAQNLSGTTVDLIAGAVDAAAIATGAIDADAIAADAITAAKIANGAIDAATFAAGAIDAAALAADAVTEIRSVASGTADSGTTTTMVDAARTEADTDYWKGAIILFTSGTIAGQARLITAFNPATDTITFAPATTQAVGTNTYEILPLAADAAAEIADKILGRSLAGGADGGRTVKDALRALRNKTEIAAGTLTVYQEDDLTPAYTAAVTTAAGNPISSIDPA